jgi:DNA repair protein RadC
LQDAPLLPSLDALLDYVRADLAYVPVEQLRAFFLDAKARLIRAEVVASGSVDQLVIHPREIARRSLELGAVGVILVHNHPSGETSPSTADIVTTRTIGAALSAIDVELHDHVIVGVSGWTSMRQGGNL